MQKIGINIWDDYCDDGYVLIGEKQSTYAYVEADITHENQKDILNLFKEKLKSLDYMVEVNLELKFYDSRKIYPNLIGTEHEWCLYQRWQLEFDDLPHKVREKIVSDISSWDGVFNGSKLIVYSES